MFPGTFYTHLVKITTKSLCLILITYIWDIFELLWLFRPYLWLTSQLFDTICIPNCFRTYLWFCAKFWVHLVTLTYIKCTHSLMLANTVITLKQSSRYIKPLLKYSQK